MDITAMSWVCTKSWAMYTGIIIIIIIINNVLI